MNDLERLAQLKQRNATLRALLEDVLALMRLNSGDRNDVIYVSGELTHAIEAELERPDA